MPVTGGSHPQLIAEKFGDVVLLVAYPGPQVAGVVLVALLLAGVHRYQQRESCDLIELKEQLGNVVFKVPGAHPQVCCIEKGDWS